MISKTPTRSIALNKECEIDIDCAGDDTICCDAKHALSKYFLNLKDKRFCVKNKPGKQLVPQMRIGAGLDVWYAECQRYVGTYKTQCKLHDDCNTVDDKCCLATKTGHLSKKLCGPETVITPKTLTKADGGDLNDGFVFKCPGYISP